MNIKSMNYRITKFGGFSIIEMLVGIVIGLIIVATSTVMFSDMLESQKEVTSSARLNQELGAAIIVMSSEIRRIGFNMCDGCASVAYNTSAADRDIEIQDVDGTNPPVAGDCILFRYNKNFDEANVQDEHRGFRHMGDKIQMAASAGIISCADDNNWLDLTDPEVIQVNLLSFSTTGSLCRKMTLPDPNPGEVISHYWIVEDDNDVQTGLACEDDWLGGIKTSPVKYCTVKAEEYATPCDDDPPNTCCTSGYTVGEGSLALAEGDPLFANHQVRIRLEAELARDDSVTKILETSVKVANPSIRIVGPAGP